MLSQNVGEKLTAAQVGKIYSDGVDRGHSCDGVVYSGTAKDEGNVAIITPDPTKGDAHFPKSHHGEAEQARGDTRDPTNADWLVGRPKRLKFLIFRTSAGDMMAKCLTPLPGA
ncbi:MAG: hypothetical protein ACYDDI_01030 [Candidatus Acidiferrales bacterium]